MNGLTNLQQSILIFSCICVFMFGFTVGFLGKKNKWWWYPKFKISMGYIGFVLAVGVLIWEIMSNW